MSNDQNLIEINGYINTETPLAILFEDGTTGKEVWIPRVAISYLKKEHKHLPTAATIKISEYWAAKKGLL